MQLRQACPSISWLQQLIQGTRQGHRAKEEVLFHYLFDPTVDKVLIQKDPPDPSSMRLLLKTLLGA
jgi:hypothetical protein